MGEPAKCRSCSAPIVWAKTEKGKAMPIDAEPTEDGNLLLTTGAGGEPTVLVARKGDALSEARYRSHFSSCPNADQHRKKAR